jgi:phosphonate transport system permease protein
VTRAAPESTDAVQAQERAEQACRYRRQVWAVRGLWILLVVVAGFCLWFTGFFGLFLPENLTAAVGNMWTTVVRECWPPDYSRWRHWIIPLLDTMAMSVAATVLGVVLAFPLALCAARNTTPNRTLYVLSRGLLNALRSIPDLIMAIFFVAAVGFGALPGVLALGLHSVGMVGKFYAEYVEHVDPAPLEAAKAAGASPLQVVVHAVIPQALPQLADVTIYRWEYHFRASVVVGMVGVGGIGAELVKATRLYRWDQAVAILSIVFILVFIVDALGAVLRRRFQ